MHLAFLVFSSLRPVLDLYAYMQALLHLTTNYYTVEIIKDNGYFRASVRKNHAEIEKAKKRFGKTVLFTNRETLSTAEIVKLYRDRNINGYDRGIETFMQELRGVRSALLFYPGTKKPCRQICSLTESQSVLLKQLGLDLNAS
ncbi:MAG: hypothetical protein M1510_02405 [Nitrospirae bacterium]|nr:hypothetical protein [Nitrospirota bacterium]MCL5238321.1 hypothetical protein [Nitrospirota bacterium]